MKKDEHDEALIQLVAVLLLFLVFSLRNPNRYTSDRPLMSDSQIEDESIR